MLDAALKYAESGLFVFPCGGSDGKKPLTKHGFHDATTDEDQIRRWWAEHPNANIGIRCGGGFWVLDVDGEEGERSLAELQGESPLYTAQVRTGRGRHLWFKGDGPRTGAKLRPGIDVRGEGGYAIAPPSLHVTSGTRYQWDVALDAMIEAPHELVAALGHRGATTPNRRLRDLPGGPAVVLTESEAEVIRSALHATAHLADAYPTWIEIAMAIHDYTRGSEQGWELWHEWSQRSPKYKDARDCWKHWVSFGRREIEVTIATLFHYAHGAGWRPSPEEEQSVYTLSRAAGEDIPEVELSEPASAPPEPTSAEAEAQPAIEFSSIPAAPPFTMPPPRPPPTPIDQLWAELPPEWLYKVPPPRRYLLRTTDGNGALPLGRAGSLSGAGGASKTYFVVQLAISVATGRDFLGVFRVDATAPRRVLLVLGEETAEECWRRVYWVCEALRLDDAEKCEVQQNVVVLPLAGRKTPLLQMTRDRVSETPHLHALRRRLTDEPHVTERPEGADGIGWGLIVLDPLARFAGVEAESSNDLATQFVQTCETLTEVPGNPTVIVVAHSSKDARRSGSVDSRGVTAITDGFRFAWGLRSKKDNIVELSTMKSNYAKDTGVVLVRRRENGILDAETEAEVRERTDTSNSTAFSEALIKNAQKDAIIESRRSRLVPRVVSEVERVPGISRRRLIAAVEGNKGYAEDAVDVAIARGSIVLLIVKGRHQHFLPDQAPDADMSPPSPAEGEGEKSPRTPQPGDGDGPGGTGVPGVDLGDVPSGDGGRGTESADQTESEGEVTW